MQINNQKKREDTKEAAIIYPCVWLYKVIGEDAIALGRAINTVCPDMASISLSKNSSSGKYCSLNVEVEVADEASRLAIYQNLKNHLAVKMVL